jgi:hypothetical protein
MPIKFDSFPKAEPGDSGLNNAAILTFTRDPIDALVKEMTQNSIDALQDGQNKLKIRISVKTIKPTQILEVKSLEKIFDQLITYWRKQKQTDFTNYFLEAKEILTRDEIYLFSFEDYNTKGLTGGIDEGTFKSLLLDEGVQGDKPSHGALGGFGIGKNAFFALTKLQTVFYSSQNSEGFKFMGVTKLAVYEDENGVKKSNRIYYGNWQNEEHNLKQSLSYLQNPNDISDIFKRTEHGLSSFAIGIKYSSDWMQHVKQALIRNYWYRFLNDGIEAEIIDEEEVFVLNMGNFKEAAEKVFENEDKAVLAYIKAYSEPQVDGVFETEIDLHGFGKIKIHLREQDSNSHEYPDKILYIRDGMMIKQESKDVGGLPKNIAGVIFCESEEGNKILSNMEPPAHDNFEPTLLPRKRKGLTEEDGKNILKQIKNAKKKAINKLKEKYLINSTSSEVVDEILSGFSNNSSSGQGSGKDNTSSDEEFHRRKKFKDHKTNPGGLSIISVVSDPINDQSSQNIDGSDGGAGGGLPGDGQRDRQGGQGPGEGIGQGGKGIKGGKTGSGKSRKRQDATIQVTFFFLKEEGGLNKYVMVVRTDKDLEDTHISFSQYGDDGGNSTPTSDLKIVSDKLNNNLGFSRDKNTYTISNLNLKTETQNVFYLSFKETSKSAFKFLNK